MVGPQARADESADDRPADAVDAIGDPMARNPLLEKQFSKAGTMELPDPVAID